MEGANSYFPVERSLTHLGCICVGGGGVEADPQASKHSSSFTAHPVLLSRPFGGRGGVFPLNPIPHGRIRQDLFDL